ncbi:MAG: 4Fe-4S binding protein [Firmicutes bacterium]|nr:4Fe-4S binding protein [Bacillota bacterium]
MSDLFGSETLLELFTRPFLEVWWEHCLHSRYRNSSCARCVQDCPTGAIRLENGQDPGAVDHKLCHGCGVCEVSCPQGVFGLRAYSRRRFLQRALTSDRAVMACTCFDDGDYAFGGDIIEIPCLGWLDEGTLLRLMAARLPQGGAVGDGRREPSAAMGGGKAGGAGLVFGIGHCRECLSPADPVITRRGLERALFWLALFGAREKVQVQVEVRPVAGGPPGGIAQARGGLRNFVKEGRRRTAAALLDVWGTVERTACEIEGHQHREDSRSTKAMWEGRIPEGRKFLLEAISGLGEPVEQELDAAQLSLKELQVAPSCDGCGICARFCPTGALRLETAPAPDAVARVAPETDGGRDGDGQGSLLLRHKPLLCVGCGFCRDICLGDSISYLPTVHTRYLCLDRDKVLIRFKKFICSRCGKPWHEREGARESGGGICPECAKETSLNESISGILEGGL